MGSYFLLQCAIMILMSRLQKPTFDERMVEVFP